MIVREKRNRVKKVIEIINVVRRNGDRIRVLVFVGSNIGVRSGNSGKRGIEILIAGEFVVVVMEKGDRNGVKDIVGKIVERENVVVESRIARNFFVLDRRKGIGIGAVYIFGRKIDGREDGIGIGVLHIFGK